MKIPVVYAQHSHGCAPTYTIEALKRMGHDTRHMEVSEFYAANPDEYDLFFCQDSGQGIDFRPVSDKTVKKACYWIWDSRFNFLQRNPGDDDMAKYVADRGGWVFQAQSPDLKRNQEQGITRVSYLPIAGDPVVWQREPVVARTKDTAFIGNCYDSGRGRALEFAKNNLGLYWPGPNGLFFEAAADVYRRSWACFHAPTFYETPHDVTGQRIDYDLTMRYYEALLCGIPIITPPMPDFDALNFRDRYHVYIYNTLEETSNLLQLAKSKMAESGYSESLRSFVVENHTYAHRLRSAFETLISAGVLCLT